MVNFERKETYSLQDLIEILRILRAPGGCPWDRAQTHLSDRRNFLEEAYEAAEAFDRDDPALMCEELGDMLMQVLFNIHGNCFQSENGIEPLESHTGIKVMSINLLLEKETEPVLWRGPVIAGVVNQFWTDVHWGDVDYMFVDMPPGTGDVPLTVFQSLPVDGVIVVASPQELVGMIVEKAVNMAAMMKKNVVGLVENMSYYVCPDCGAKHEIFGASRADGLAALHGIPNVAKLPIDPRLAACSDGGLMEVFSGDWLDGMADAVEKL